MALGLIFILNSISKNLKKIKCTLLERLSIGPLYLSVKIGSLQTLLVEGMRQCMSKTIKLFITINPMSPLLETYLRK